MHALLSAEAKPHSLLTSCCMIAPMPGGVAVAAEAGAAATVAAGKLWRWGLHRHQCGLLLPPPVSERFASRMRTRAPTTS